VARVINCTGPDMKYRRVRSSLLNSLFAQGLIVAGPHGPACGPARAAVYAMRTATFPACSCYVGTRKAGHLIESIAVPSCVNRRELAELLAEKFAAASGIWLPNTPQAERF